MTTIAVPPDKTKEAVKLLKGIDPSGKKIVIIYPTDPKHK
jgi:hypothetical protein